MIFENCTISLIIPFGFEKSCYELIDSETEHGFHENFTEVAFSPEWLNTVGRARFLNQESRLFRCFELKHESRQIIGLAKNNKPIYRLTRNDCRTPFNIDNIRVWFWKYGKAFFSIQITAKNLTENDAFNLKKFLTDIKTRQKIAYSKNLSRTEKTTQNFTIKNLISSSNGEYTDLFTLIKPFAPKDTPETLKRAYSITYCVADALPPETADDKHYIVEKYKIHWAFSEHSLNMTGDFTNEFVARLGAGLHRSVFYDYMLLYQYYLCLYIECFEAKAYIESLGTGTGTCDREQIEKWLTLFDGSLDQLTSEDHINTIFREYLCKNVWNLQAAVEETTSKCRGYSYRGYAPARRSYDVFISFKNLDGNGRPTEDSKMAKELFEKLKERKINVFFSNDTLANQGNNDWISAINDALELVFIFILVGTSTENINSYWVSKEWNAALTRRKPIFAYIKGITCYALPPLLCQTTVFEHGRHSLESICGHIENAVKREAR